MQRILVFPRNASPELLGFFLQGVLLVHYTSSRALYWRIDWCVTRNTTLDIDVQMNIIIYLCRAHSALFFCNGVLLMCEGEVFSAWGECGFCTSREKPSPGVFVYLILLWTSPAVRCHKISIVFVHYIIRDRFVRKKSQRALISSSSCMQTTYHLF